MRLRRLVDGVERVVEKSAEALGTVTFLGVALVLIFAWIGLNGGYAFFSGALHKLATGQAYDPAPWILLNLIFSFEAFFTGSLVIIAGKAREKRDKVQQDYNEQHREELAERTISAIESMHETLKRVEAAVSPQEPRTGERGENPSSPLSAV